MIFVICILIFSLLRKHAFNYGRMAAMDDDERGILNDLNAATSEDGRLLRVRELLLLVLVSPL